MLHLDIGITSEVNYSARSFRSRAQYDRATDADLLEYTTVLDKNLSTIQLPLQALYCKNVFYQEHTKYIDAYCDSIIQACLDATDKYIPKTKKRVIAGWKDICEPVRDTAIFWHMLWVNNGRPHHGIYHSRNQTYILYVKHVLIINMLNI